MAVAKATRRGFLGTSLLAASSLPFASPAILSARSPNERIRLAAVGVGGKGWVDISSASKHGDVVAYCDVDTSGKLRRGGYGAAAAKWTSARGYVDWRKMIEAKFKNLDGVTVSTPDHMHAPVTMMALKHGLAVYTQKPLTRTIHEARALTQTAAAAKVSTQMGNQHHSGAGYRTLVRWIRGGLIGKVKVAHAWSDRPIWPQGHDRPSGRDPVPEELNWDLWLGVAADRPFKKEIYHPFKWRGWYDFGAGALGDMGCHIIDPVVWALELASPLSVSYQGPTPNAETFPESEVLRYRFPGTQHTAGETLTMTWYDGGNRPSSKGTHLPDDGAIPKQGAMFIGEEATLVCQHGKMPKLYPEAKFATVRLAAEGAVDHYGSWADGIRDGSQPGSNFAYAGPLTETVLLGVVAARIGEGELKWDANEMRFTNSDRANRFVGCEYRKGWEIEGL
jgi:predicted dehydrogenase